jgi:ubiquinone/menaquinone biosynthesis C-methylase UbiE
MNNNDFSSVTEVAGYNVTKEQIQRMYTRYHFSAQYSKGKDVLEVACGSGQGLGFLAGSAKKVVGGDIDENLINIAKNQYKNRQNISLDKLDAHKLPFIDGSFDVVLIHEAIYYFKDPRAAIKEVFRVLRKNGVIIISTANKDWEGFNPSPYSYAYFSANDFPALLAQAGFNDISMYGDCPTAAKGVKEKVVSGIKKIAVNMRLIPKTMKGKELFKRMFYGKLIKMPGELREGFAESLPPSIIDKSMPNRGYKVLFAVGFKKETR